MSIRDIPNGVALPASAQFKLRPSGVPARRTRMNIKPYQAPNGAINSIQKIEFYIPSKHQTMIDPQTMYLRGTITGVTCPTARKARLNRNAFSLFNRLRVYGQDTTLLEDIENYNDLCHTIADISMSREDKLALSTIFGGNDSSVTTSFTAYLDADYTRVYNRNSAGAGVDVATDATGADAAHCIEIGRLGSDVVAGGVGVSADIPLEVNPTTTTLIDNGYNFADANAELDFCIPIVSSFGLLADTLIPTGNLNADLRFDFFTEVPNVAFRAHDGAYANAEDMTSYQLKNLELIVDQINFEGEAVALVEQFAPRNGPLYLYASTYKTYTTSLTATNQGFMSQLLPHRSLSVKQVLSSTHRPTTKGYDSFARVLPYGGTNLNASLNIGGSPYPQIPVDRPAELFAELQKSQHSFNQLMMSGSISRTEYRKWNTDLSSIANSLTCKPVIGWDLETWDKKGSTIINGQNWTGLNVMAQGNVAEDSAGNQLTTGLTTHVAEDSAGNQLTTGLTTHHFVNYDVIYVIQDGVISVRF